MSNNNVDFYLLNLTDIGNYINIVIYDENGKPVSGKKIPVMAVNNPGNGMMTEVFTGRTIYKASGRVENHLTYDSASFAKLEDLEEMDSLLSLIDRGYDIRNQVAICLSDIDRSIKDKYKRYTEKANRLNEFYFDNMDRMYGRGR